MGFLITVSECPIVWVSELQSEIVISSMEAKIIALEDCCCELFPIVDVITKLGNVMGLETKDLVSMHVSIHEDNAGTLVLAETIPHKFILIASTMQSKLFGFMKKSRSVVSSYPRSTQLNN